MIGKIFGHLKVIVSAKHGYYTCKCICGNYQDIRKDKLVYGLKTDCGCKRKEKIQSNWIGKRFDKLVLIKLLEGRKCLCKCDCGNETIVFTSNLGRGNTTSCGCVFTSTNGITHGLLYKYLSEYRSWSMMKNRCLNENSTVHIYYKDVSICNEWIKSFSTFMNDMGEKPLPKKEYSIDRINNELGYYPENCRWATKKEQANNRRKRNTVKQ